MENKVCIIQNVNSVNKLKNIKVATADDDNNSIIENRQLMSSKFNDVVFVPNETATNQNSVIQQGKNVKHHSSAAYSSMFDVNTDFSAQANNDNTYEHSNSPMIQFLKPFANHQSVINNSDGSGSQNEPNPPSLPPHHQPNTLYVIDSNRKLNILDPTHRMFDGNPLHQFATNDENKNTDQLGVSGAGSGMKKFPEIYSSGAAVAAATAAVVNFHPEQLAATNLSLNDYFNSYVSNVPTGGGGGGGDSGGGRSSESPMLEEPRKHTRGRKRSKKGPFICSECRKEFSNQSTLTKHMITHSDERKFVCPQCSKAFKRHDHLNGHMLTHREHKPYACDIEGCDKSYCDARSLRRHKEKHKENALAGCTEGLSQKLPSLTNATAIDKAITNNIYLPINASAQLQYLALQQQKIQTNQDPDDSQPANGHHVSTFEKASEKQLFAQMNGSKNIDDHHHHHHHHQQQQQQQQQQELTKRMVLPSQDSDNALLHQLLTNQDKRVKTTTTTSAINHSNGSTVIKLNDNYNQVANSVTVNYIVNQVKSTEHSSGGGAKQAEETYHYNGLPSTSKLDDKCDDDGDGDSLECMVCQKRFKSISSLNGHMRLHGGFFRLNYLLNSKTNPTDDLVEKGPVEYPSLGAYEEPKDYQDIQLFEKAGELEYGNEMNLQSVQHGEFKMPLNYVSNQKQTEMLNSSLYNPYNKANEASLMLQENHYSEVRSEQSKQPQAQPPPPPPPVMFSPITPVTPLKDNSQFTFEFTAKQPEPKIESLCKPPAPMSHYTPEPIESDLVESGYCFDSKENDLLEKSDIDNIVINTAADTNLANFTDIDTTGQLEKSEPNVDFQQDSFHNFDLPSCKLTSDLYNRRLRRNMDDSSKTRELLSIKQIAASLQSFSQSYERNHHQNVLNQQQMNHSYSVPTTPCMPNSNQFQNQHSYEMNHLSHHSLPATPIDSEHFTFKVSNVCHQTSLPNTPIEHQQQQQQHFQFSNPVETVEPSDDILNSRTFDLSCLNDAQYTDFIGYNSKEIESDFIDNESFKEPHLITYSSVQEATGDGTDLPVNTCDKHLEDLQHKTFSDNEFPFDSTANYPTTSIGKTAFCETKNDIDLSLNQPDGPIINEETFETINNELVNDKAIHFPSVEPEKDINSNYIIKDSYEKPVVEVNNILKPKPGCLKTFIKKHSVATNVTSHVPFKKKKPRPEPLYIPPHVNTFVYHSRLRSPRIWNSSIIETKHITPPPYTPPPMLSPVRSGTGLFWKITTTTTNSLIPPKCYPNLSSAKFSKKIDQHIEDLKTPTTAYEPYEYDIPQTDIQPHVNIGPNYQARIPAFNRNRSLVNFKPDHASLVWNPTVLDSVSEEELELYLKVSCSMCVPGKGNNREYALHLLYDCKGKILDALSKMLNNSPMLNTGHPLSGYSYSNNCIWSCEEISIFKNNILNHDKDFFMISQEIQTKSVKECIEFYYIWKKNCPDVVRKLRFIRRKREHEAMFYDIPKCSTNGTHDKDSENEFKKVKTTTTTGGGGAQYACSKCGKTFKKLKSRSAHMKIHGNNG